MDKRRVSMFLVFVMLSLSSCSLQVKKTITEKVADEEFVSIKDYNACVDKHNEYRLRLIATNEALKGNTALLRQIEKDRNRQKWKYFGIGGGLGAGIVAILVILFRFIPGR